MVDAWLTADLANFYTTFHWWFDVLVRCGSADFLVVVLALGSFSTCGCGCFKYYGYYPPILSHTGGACVLEMVVFPTFLAVGVFWLLNTEYHYAALAFAVAFAGEFSTKFFDSTIDGLAKTTSSTARETRIQCSRNRGNCGGFA